MNIYQRLSIFITISLFAASCAARQDKSDDAVLNFTGTGITELGVVSVKKGVERGSVEWHLIADKVGEDYVTRYLEREFGLQRIRADRQLEDILRTKFNGVNGKDMARDLWQQYRSATFSYLESGNATIIFFDSNNRAVVAWPLIDHVT